MPEGESVNRMFAGIADRYDLANHVLSGGMDYGWRRVLVQCVRRHGAREILDLATGSGDVAFALARALPDDVRIVGMDFCQPMLDQAIQKQPTKRSSERITFVQGDALNLPLDDARFDAVTIAFGVRNFEDRDRGLRSIHRVLKPGGLLLVLEFSQPYRWFAPVYFAYLRHVLPRIAAWITRDKHAYDYLADSIQAFPGRDAFADEFRRAGFAQVEAYPLTLGTVALHCAMKAD